MAVKGLSYAILQDKINLRKVFKSIDLQVSGFQDLAAW